MDGKRGTYFTLNEVGGRVWEIVGTGATTSQIVGLLLDEYEVDRETLETDVAATLRRLLDDRLAAHGQVSSSVSPELPLMSSPSKPDNAPKLRVPSALWCGLLIAWFKGLLRAQGFLGTLEWIRRRTERVTVVAEAEIATLKAAEYAVAMAGAFYPGRAKCLEQSLVLYYLLRRHGVRVKYCHGVQPFPFQAHAWIEYQGQVINDISEHAWYFARFPEMLP